MRIVKVAHIATVAMSLRYLLLNQLLSIQDEGFRVFGISSFGPEASVIAAAGIQHIPVEMTRSFTPLADVASLVRLYDVIKQEKFTIVHTHSPKAGFLGQIAAKMARVPIVINTLHGFYFHDQMPASVRHFYIILEKVAAQCSDSIFSQNKEDIQTAIQERICPLEKIKHLGNGIDVRHFDPKNFAPQESVRKRLEVDMPVGAKVVGFVGRLVREKGLLELFAAARMVREWVPNVQFILVGPLDTHKRDAVTPDAAQEYGVADICRFLGMRHGMPELYALMDVFVLPSHREGFPRAPMEASAMKVPCVVTDIRGCRGAVEHGRNGLLVPRGDSKALARAIVEILGDPEKARMMGEEGRRIAEQHFDERLVFSKVKAEYVRLLRQKGLPVPTPLATLRAIAP